MSKLLVYNCVKIDNIFYPPEVADFVKCTACDKLMLTKCFEDDCPACDAKGSLMWACDVIEDENRQEVYIDSMVNSSRYTLV